MVSAAKIDRLTDRIIAYRFWRYYKRKYEERRLADMALELKGLKAKATVLRATLEDVGLAYDELTSSGKLHASEVRGLVTDLGGMKDDLSFSIGEVGNSSAITGTPEKPVEPAKPPPVTLQAAVDPAIQQPPAAPPAAILNGQPTMRGDVQLIRS